LRQTYFTSLVGSGSVSAMPFRSIDPTTGETWRTFPETSAEEIEAALERAVVGQRAWRDTAITERARLLCAVGARLRAGAAEHAVLMAREMGKPVVDGEAEIEKCAVACDWYAEHAATLLAPDRRPFEPGRAYLRFEPLGTVLAIMPWNFPFWQVFRAAVPIVTAGNAVVLKHAENTQGCAAAIHQVFETVGMPGGVFQTLHVTRDRAEELIGDARIAAVTLTGSTAAGRAVAAAAGRAIKKSVLELGGSDAFVVLDDADLERTVRGAADARLVNAGQSCIAAKRFIVVDSVANAFVERLVAEVRTRRVGNPLDRATQVGPMARRDLRDALHRQVDASVVRGARLLLGGAIPDGPGAFYPPSVLDAVVPGMPAFDEETFGPVAAIVRARDEAHAIRLANTSPYGLGGSVWSQDVARAERVAANIEAGAVFVNGQVRSDPRLPFGGVKQSGYGRELAEYAIREFVNVKTVVVRDT
jgi:succinate-semialdehyde dehydrogenase/glutarate-semialdehyde dehydrogenase